MDSERRRAVFERARDRAIALGMPMESGPLFSGWIEEWIAGAIDVNELKARYSSLLRQRRDEHKGKVVFAEPNKFPWPTADDLSVNGLRAHTDILQDE